MMAGNAWAAQNLALMIFRPELATVAATLRTAEL
jgi:hypothetical protein